MILFYTILMYILFYRLPTTNGIQCERITVPACQGLGYNMTAMPNLAGHTSQLEAEEKINELLPILDSECSKHARFLVCASMFPLCSPDVSRPVTACRTVCETVKLECSSYAVLALHWPKFMDCDSLPQPEKQELCMQVPQPDSKLEKIKQLNTWPWMLRKNSYLLQPMSKIICPTNFTPYGYECGSQCGTDSFYTTHQKKIAETWTLVLSAICFILTLFSLVTFWAEPMRFGYPERPVLFLALCYNLLSVCYLERVIFHNPVKDGLFNDQGGLCAVTSPCLASYIATSYLTLCAAIWWLIFSICWYLSTEKQWSSEALEKKSGLFHVIAWIPPLAAPISALLWGAVSPHELTGMCISSGFVEIPSFILLISGAFFTVLASKSLKGLSVTVNDDSFKRLSQVRTRILIFSCVFFVPAFLAVCLSFLEETNFQIIPCIFGDPCIAPEKHSSIPTLLKLFFILAGGSFAGMWVWSKKTCESYRSRVSTVPSTINIKSAAYTPSKKIKGMGPLYAGINFHNIPVYNVSNSTVGV